MHFDKYRGIRLKRWWTYFKHVLESQENVFLHVRNDNMHQTIEQVMKYVGQVDFKSNISTQFQASLH